MTDRALDADRKPGFPGDFFDEANHPLHVAELAMRVRADAVLADRHAANLGDLARHFLTRQHAALAGFRALRKLDFDSAHERVARERLLKLRHREAAVGIAAPELASADLVNHVGAVFMVRRKPALARVVITPGK